MLFEIVKKVGSAKTVYVKKPDALELVQVHKWKEWDKLPDGREVNYFLYSTNSDHDLYVNIDREFLDLYKDPVLSNLLVNIINDEIHCKLLKKEAYKHKFNAYNVYQLLSDNKLSEIKADKLTQISDYLCQVTKGGEMIPIYNWLRTKGYKFESKGISHSGERFHFIGSDGDGFIIDRTVNWEQVPLKGWELARASDIHKRMNWMKKISEELNPRTKDPETSLPYISDSDKLFMENIIVSVDGNVTRFLRKVPKISCVTRYEPRSYFIKADKQ